MRPVLRHVTLIARRLTRAPAFSIAATLTLALGIGATAAVATVVGAVLLRPLPYSDAEQLVAVSHELSLSGLARVDQSDATYLYYRRASRTLSDIGLYRTTAAQVGGVSGGRAMVPERAPAALATASLFHVLAARPLRGRAFVDADDDPDATPVVLIGEGLWRTRFGGDSSIVGRRIDVDGTAREVVGILPSSFGFPRAGTDVWLPLAIDPAHTRSAAFDFSGVGRLRPGVTAAHAEQELRNLLPRVPEAYPGRLTAAAIAVTKMRPVVAPLRDTIVGDVGRVLWVVLAAVVFVLLVACANVVNLFLVRAEARQHEIAVRRALGASPGSIAWQFLGEGLALAAVGGTAGFLVAAIAVRAAATLPVLANVPRMNEVRVDGVMVAGALAITGAAALLVSLLPAMRAMGAGDTAALSHAGRTATADRTRHRARHALVVAQIALALVLVSGALLMARSFAALRDVRPGFDASHAFTFRVTLLDVNYRTAADVAHFVDRLTASVGHVPGARVAGVVTKLPLADAMRADTALFIEDHPLAPGTMPNIHQVAFATPEYFRAIGMPLLEGRTFAAIDPARPVHDVVVTRTLAERYWAGGHAVGKRIRFTPLGPWYTIVGVTDEVRGTGLDQPPDETVFLPLVTQPAGVDTARFAPRDVAVVVRSAGAPERLAPSIAQTVRALDPEIAMYQARPMNEVVADAEARTRVTMLMLAAASVIALALGAVGIYGVVAYIVTLRTPEIAVRLALGAEPSRVRAMVSRQSLVVGAIGVAVGVALAGVATRVLATLLFGVSPLDPLSLGGAGVLLLIIAFVASWIPATRAAGVDPAQVLRAE